MKTCCPAPRASVVCFALVVGIWSCCGTFASLGAEKDIKAKASRKNNNPKKSGELYVPLVPKPTDVSYSGEVPLQPATIFLEKVADDRENKAQIGQNIEDEDKPPIKVLADEGDGPTEFVQKLAAKQFHDLGLPLAGEAASAQRLVSLKLTRFWAEEAPSYHGIVRVAAEVKDAAGKVLWRGALVGENKRFGRSLKPENYRETLTDATQSTVNKMFADANFQKAISKE